MDAIARGRGGVRTGLEGIRQGRREVAHREQQGRAERSDLWQGCARVSRLSSGGSWYIILLGMIGVGCACVCLSESGRGGARRGCSETVGEERRSSAQPMNLTVQVRL